MKVSLFGRRRGVLAAAAALLCASLASACGEDAPQPAGQPNAAMVQLAAEGWVSQDTVVSIDPATGEETVRAYTTDLSPDTLASGEVVYRAAEYMPVLESCATDPDPLFCTQTTLAAFTRDHLRYPRQALVRGIGGAGVVTFVISPRGKVTRTGIGRSLGDLLDAEMLRLAGTLPPWRPGFHDGAPVAVRYQLPVTFVVPRDE